MVCLTIASFTKQTVTEPSRFGPDPSFNPGIPQRRVATGNESPFKPLYSKTTHTHTRHNDWCSMFDVNEPPTRVKADCFPSRFSHDADSESALVFNSLQRHHSRASFGLELSRTLHHPTDKRHVCTNAALRARNASEVYGTLQDVQILKIWISVLDSDWSESAQQPH